MVRATTKIETPKATCRNPKVKANGVSGLSRVRAAVALGLSILTIAMVANSRAAQLNPLAQAQQAFTEKQSEFQKQPHSLQVAWEFARACFDLADLATNRSQRAAVAQQGIDASRAALTLDTNSAPAHYYLGLNLGELARTKMLGALRLVAQMETEFTTAARLDSHFDYGGPDRSLGLLYRDAPSLGSIGDRTKARTHLKRALELAPDYPENRLNLVESELKWNERPQAREQLKLLEQLLPKARERFTGPAWASSWADWDTRLADVRQKLDEPSRLEAPHH